MLQGFTFLKNYLISSINVYYLWFISLLNVSHVILFSVLVFCIIYLLFHLEKCLGFLCLCLWSWKGKMRNPKLLYICVILFGVLRFFIKNIRISVFVYYFILKNISVYLCLKGKWETQKNLVLLRQATLPWEPHVVPWQLCLCVLLRHSHDHSHHSCLLSAHPHNHHHLMPIKKWVSVWICR